MTRIDYAPPPEPAWRSVDGPVGEAGDADNGDVTSDQSAAEMVDVEIDLTIGPAVARPQHPMVDHPWAVNWPTWISLSIGPRLR